VPQVGKPSEGGFLQPRIRRYRLSWVVRLLSPENNAQQGLHKSLPGKALAICVKCRIFRLTLAPE